MLCCSSNAVDIPVIACEALTFLSVNNSYDICDQRKCLFNDIQRRYGGVTALRLTSDGCGRTCETTANFIECAIVHIPSVV